MQSITVSFQEYTKTDVKIELDSDKNGGKKQFRYGEPAWFRVYAPNPAAVQVGVSDGSVLREQIGTGLMVEEVIFTEGASGRLSRHAVSLGAVQWLGRSLGSITLTGGKGVATSATASPAFPAVAEVQYHAPFALFRLTLPERQRGSYPVIVTVYDA